MEKQTITWGGLKERLTPLISFHSIIDEDMGVLKDVIINYRNEEIFNLDIKRNKFQIIGDLYRRKYENPLYYIMKDEKYKSFVDECYEEFITEKEDEILNYSISTEIYQLIEEFKKSNDIIPTILYYSEAQRKVIENDALLSKINYISFSNLISNRDRIEDFGQFFFKRINESNPFKDFKAKTYYFSTCGLNLNEDNSDLNMDNDFVFHIYKNGGRISLFDLYRTDVIGGYD